MRYLYSFFFCFGFILSIRAQTVSNEQNRTWFLLLNQYRINKKWSITNEVHQRTNRLFKEQGQFLLRPSLDYHFNSSATISAGYTFVHIGPFNGDSKFDFTYEHNIWEQLSSSFSWGKLLFQNRLRLEHRWVETFQSEGNFSKIKKPVFSNRIRNRLTASRQIYQFKGNQSSLFVNAFDEIWFNQGKWLNPTDFFRNWLYVGAGVVYNQHTKIQLGLMHQFDRVAFEHYTSTPIIQFTLIHDFIGEKQH